MSHLDAGLALIFRDKQQDGVVALVADLFVELRRPAISLLDVGKLQSHNGAELLLVDI